MEKALALLAIWFGKKATVYTIGRMYGFPRVFRRLIEFNRSWTSNKDKLKNRSLFIKYFFRIPNRISWHFKYPKDPT